MHFPLASPLTSLFLSYHFSKKKNYRNKSQKKKFSDRKQVHVGTKLNGNDTTILHTIPTTSCTILPTMHTTNFTLASSHPLKECYHNKAPSTACSLHSPLHKRQTIGDMFSSNKSSQHNLHFNIPYKLSTAHILYSICTQDRPHHMLSSH